VNDPAVRCMPHVQAYANSGGFAGSLAMLAGAARILYLGLDCKPAADGRRHWHGAHPPGLGDAVSMPVWSVEIQRLAGDARNEGVEVINCSRDTALTCFPRVPLEAALGVPFLREHYLAKLIRNNGLRRVAELGIWKGRTFLHLLAHTEATVIGVDAWRQRPENDGVPGGETYSTWDMEAYESNVRERAAAYGSRAQILKMETFEAAQQIEDGSLDLVFIDADHSEAGVRRDLLDWMPKVRRGGYITGHDIDWPTVRGVVEEFFADYERGPDNVWAARA